MEDLRGLAKLYPLTMISLTEGTFLSAASQCAEPLNLRFNRHGPVCNERWSELNKQANNGEPISGFGAALTVGEWT